jgi:CO/xanthine dehydrogenase Mo-binding subunit
MVHGRVVRPWVRTPVGAGRVAAVDDAGIRSMPGVVAVVREGDFIGVVAEREEQAIRAADALRERVTWVEGEPLPPPAAFREAMPDRVAEVRAVDDTGGIDAALETAERVVRSTYVFPYIAHASLGPSCAVADVRKEGATVWSATQGPYALRRTLAPLLGLPETAVRVIHREGAGCYGHNGADDVAADAAILSRAVGRPVRVQWSRRDEFAWEPKSPAMAVEMAAGLDAGGGIVAWTHDVWTPTHTARPNGEPGTLLAGQELGFGPSGTRFGGGDRNAPVTYAIPERRTTAHWVGESPLRTSALRSLGATANSAANEWFLDEIAHATGVDPVALRLRLLGDPRSIAVVEAVAGAAGWGTPLPSREGMLAGRGVAFVRYELDHAYVATVAEAAVDPASGEVRATRVVVAHDCGRIVNPDGVRAQVEGNVVQGVSRALKEAVTWDERAVTSLTWAEYPILTFPDVPAIEVVLIDRPEAPSLGAGEPAICTVPAAIGNAIFAATGVRLRELPFTPDRVRAALAGG